jgi:hypothetical protein
MYFFAVVGVPLLAADAGLMTCISYLPKLAIFLPL